MIDVTAKTLNATNANVHVTGNIASNIANMSQPPQDTFNPPLPTLTELTPLTPRNRTYTNTSSPSFNSPINYNQVTPTNTNVTRWYYWAINIIYFAQIAKQEIR